MLIMSQNNKVMFNADNSRLYVQQSNSDSPENLTKPWVVVAYSESRNPDPHPIIVSSHSTEEEAMSALAYIYAMAVAKQPAISMPKNTLNLEQEAASTIIANSLAETCF